MASRTEIAHRAVYEHKALQKPAELAFILSQVIPSDFVLEIGGDSGGTTWALTECGATVLTVDVGKGPFSTGSPFHCPKNAMYLQGDSHAESTRSRVKEWLGSSRLFDMLIIDGDHTYDGVRSDYHMYKDLVNSTGRVVFHDICHHSDPKIGVRRFWHELIKETMIPYREFVVDPTDWGGVGILGTVHSL